MIVCSSSYDTLYFCGISCNVFSFISDFILVFFFLVSLAKSCRGWTFWQISPSLFKIRVKQKVKILNNFYSFTHMTEKTFPLIWTEYNKEKYCIIRYNHSHHYCLSSPHSIIERLLMKTSHTSWSIWSIGNVFLCCFCSRQKDSLSHEETIWVLWIKLRY